MEIEAAHCALRHQAGGLGLFELVQTGETPIGPHVDLLRFRGNAWKLIADLMVNAAVNHERSNSNDMGNRGNFGPVSYGQRISQSHIRAADDANGGGCICEHLVVKVGRLTSTEKIKSDTAIERIVRIFLRLLRSRFLKISVRYFIIFPCSGYAEIWSEAVAFVDAPPFSAPVNTPLSKR